MRISFIEIGNFRRLKSCRIDIGNEKTVFVGANNCGKTSAMEALIMFLKEKSNISTRDFTLSNWKEINRIGDQWKSHDEDKSPDLSIKPWEDYLPHLDIWLNVPNEHVYHVSQLIPTLDWTGGKLGIRLRIEPDNLEKLYKEFIEVSSSSSKIVGEAKKKDETLEFNLWPRTLWDFLERRIRSHFIVRQYLLDETKLNDPIDGLAKSQKLTPESIPLDFDAFKGLIRINVISAQRGFSDSNTTPNGNSKLPGNLSSQLRDYYTKHLDPNRQPDLTDLQALKAIQAAKTTFDEKLNEAFAVSIKELESLNYPGFGGNPSITLSSRINEIDSIDHSSAVQFKILNDLDGASNYPLSLPEKYNGLGYQNLISMVFMLIRFRDEWMQVGKDSKREKHEDEIEFEPLHLVLVEEPEAYLHAQVQQVFIKKAYDVLVNHKLLETNPSAFTTQLIVSTHSNHIAHEIEFKSLRYFKRKHGTKEEVPTSTVVNLSRTFGTEDETTKFAIRYLKTTHCDLFFADAVILIEGPAERILLPHFIRNHFKSLVIGYIAILEIGGSHAHRLQPLLEDLGITTLIITDLDSIDTTGRSVLPELGKSYATKNTTLKKWLPAKQSVDELVLAKDEEKTSLKFPTRVAYQYSIIAKGKQDPAAKDVIPYTFEVALAFENLEFFQNAKGNGLFKNFKTAANETTVEKINENLFTLLKNAKKAELALDILFNEESHNLNPPQYIKDGLNWLQERLSENGSI